MPNITSCRIWTGLGHIIIWILGKLQPHDPSLHAGQLDLRPRVYSSTAVSLRLIGWMSKFDIQTSSWKNRQDLLSRPDLAAINPWPELPKTNPCYSCAKKLQIVKSFVPNYYPTGEFRWCIFNTTYMIVIRYSQTSSSDEAAGLKFCSLSGSRCVGGRGDLPGMTVFMLVQSTNSTPETVN